MSPTVCCNILRGRKSECDDCLRLASVGSFRESEFAVAIVAHEHALATWSGRWKKTSWFLYNWIAHPTTKMKPENHELGVPRWPPQDFRLIETMATSVATSELYLDRNDNLAAISEANLKPNWRRKTVERDWHCFSTSIRLQIGFKDGGQVIVPV